MSPFESESADLTSAKQRRIFVCIYSWYYLRHIRPALEELADRGHLLRVISLVDDGPDFRCSVEELSARYPNITYQTGPVREDEWAERSVLLRQIQCWLQSQEPRFDEACRFSDTRRVHGRQPLFLEKPFFSRPLGRELAWRAFRRLDQALPRVPEIDAIFAEFKPDVMVITPLIDREGAMWDYMYSARAAGVRTAFPVHSWDNLSSKARVIVFPDRVLVWNETQRDEAQAFHHVPRRRIVITGAQGFDEFFAMKPSMTREAFISRLGLRADRPILLYVCSAILKRHVPREMATTISPELAYFTRWITEIRSADDPRISEANVVIRPHPKRDDHWDHVDLRQWGGRIVVHPARGHLPNDQSSKETFFDLLVHAEVVVGLNTSAMIEAAIVGRPVMTVLDDNYRGAQENMQHFQYLLHLGGGLLSAHADLEGAHCSVAGLAGPSRQGARAGATLCRKLRASAWDRPLSRPGLRRQCFGGCHHVASATTPPRYHRPPPHPRDRGLEAAEAQPIQALDRCRVGNQTPAPRGEADRNARGQGRRRKHRASAQESQNAKRRFTPAAAQIAGAAGLLSGAHSRESLCFGLGERVKELAALSPLAQGLTAPPGDPALGGFGAPLHPLEPRKREPPQERSI